MAPTPNPNERYFRLGARTVGQVVGVLNLWQLRAALAHGVEAQSAEACRFGMLARAKLFTFYVLRELTRQGLLPEAGTLTVRLTDDALPTTLQEALDRLQPEDLDAEP